MVGRRHRGAASGLRYDGRMAGPSVTLATASLARDASGTPFSAEYQDIYHSAHGGL